MEVLSLQFVVNSEPVMAFDNPSQRLEMSVPLTGMTSISLAKGIDLARAVWNAFNPTGEDIAPYITSVSECKRYRIKRSNVGILEYATTRTMQGVFAVEAKLPTREFLNGVQSDNNVVKVTPPMGLYEVPPDHLNATINTSKVFAPKKSPLAKLVEIAIKAVASPTARPSLPAANPSAASENSLPRTSSEGIVSSEGTAELA